MNSKMKGILVFVTALFAFSLLVGMEPAGAKGSGKACKILIAKKSIPLKIFQKHDGKILTQWFRANSTKEVWEKKEEEGGGWDFWILLLFSQPCNATELEVSFYDTEIFPKHLINSFALMLMKKGEKIIPHHVQLTKKEFKANHQYMIQITQKGVIKGEQKFNLRGAGVKYSGEVSFTDEEANGKSEGGGSEGKGKK
jgi:hypothetical protein